MLKKGMRISWMSRGRGGEMWRQGIVRARVAPGRRARVPAGAIFKARPVNSVHDRYLVEIARADVRTGRRLPSLWMAPKARWLEENLSAPSTRRRRRVSAPR